MNKDEIKNAFISPGHAVAFSAPQTVANYFKISKKAAKEILQELDSYNLHKEYKRPSVFNPYFVYRRRDHIQADLIEVRNISRHNDGVNYLLLLIDIFSRKIWVYPMKNKTGKETENKLRQWLNEISRGRKVKLLMTDAGREFFNQHVESLLQQENINHRLAHGTCKAAYAERVNKTIQILIYKYLTQKETLRYIDVLQDLVKTYNNREHRSLKGMSPKDADKAENENYVRGVLMQKYSSIKRKRPKLKIGDMVRIKTEAKQIVSSRRAYAEQYHGEYFKIYKINTKLPIPLYYLVSMNTEEKISGGFYENELSKVKGDVFKIEKILKWRGKGIRKEALVRWKYFDSRWDEWIPASNLINEF